MYDYALKLDPLAADVVLCAASVPCGGDKAKAKADFKEALRTSQRPDATRGLQESSN